MGWKVKSAAIALVTLCAAGVSTFAGAAGTCRSTCDEKHVDCARGKPESVCLDQWRMCKTACMGGQKAVTPVATPVKVVTTTTIAPAKGGAKVVATNTKISH